MKPTMTYLMLGLLFVLVGCQEHLSVQKSAMLFSDSERSDLAIEHQKSILKFAVKGREQMHCTAFWIQSQNDRQLVATARHCVLNQNNLSEDCRLDLFKFEDFKNNQFRCKSIVIDDPKHDTFILEVESISESSDIEKSPLILTKMDPLVGISLSMYGFPSDTIRKSKATHTRKCTITGDSIMVYDRFYSTGVPNNCSTWGGNSGGPILVEGTSFVIGVPGTFLPMQRPDQLLDSYSNIVQGFYEDIGDFISRNQEKLLEEGIDFQELDSEMTKEYIVTKIDASEAYVRETIKNYYRWGFSNSLMILERFNLIRVNFERLPPEDVINFVSWVLHYDDLEVAKKFKTLDPFIKALELENANGRQVFKFVKSEEMAELLELHRFL